MNSQGSRELGKGLLEMACAPDGVTEAAEFFFGGAWQLGKLTEKLTNLLAWDGMGMLVGGDWSMNGLFSRNSWEWNNHPN